jgi:biopolymer transport protein ExbD
MKLVSPLPHKRGRLEIIPLIDIMFFLLAAFMVVSIGKIHVKSLKVSLPTDVPAAQKEPKEDFIDISVDENGQIQLDKQLIASKEALFAQLQALYAKNKDQKFLISADKEARHGDVVGVLGTLRSVGFQKVGFSIKNETSPPPAQSAAPAPAPPAPLAPPAEVAPAPVSAPSGTTRTSPCREPCHRPRCLVSIPPSSFTSGGARRDPSGFICWSQESLC